MPTHVQIWYEGKDEGSRIKPIKIISEGKFGEILAIYQLSVKRLIYRITLKTDDDPEEILRELRGNGEVSVLKMAADDHVIFQSKRWKDPVPNKK